MTEQLNWTELSFNKKINEKEKEKKKTYATCLSNLFCLSLSFYPVCISKLYVQHPHLRCLTGISELRCLKWNPSPTMLCSGFVFFFFELSKWYHHLFSYTNPLTFTCCSPAKTIFKPLSPVEVSSLFCLLRYHHSLNYQYFLLQDTWLVSILSICKPDSKLSDFLKNINYVSV